MSKIATLIRTTRLVWCGTILVRFMPRAVGSHAAIATGIRLLRVSGLGVACLRGPRFHTALLSANRTDFIGADLAIAIPVETTENVRSLAHFCVIDHTVVVRIESAEKTGHRTLRLPPRLFATRFTFAFLRAFTRRTGRTFRCARLPAGTRLRAVLREERPRGKRERHRSDECLVWFHWIGGVAMASRPAGRLSGWRKGEHP